MQEYDQWNQNQHVDARNPPSQQCAFGLILSLLDNLKFDEFLNTPSDVEPRVPMPDSDGHPILHAILAGVKDLQRSSVTRDQLKQLVELQRAEFRSLVRAETEPLHTAVEQIHWSICMLAQENEQTEERMRKIESKVDQFQNASLPSPTLLRASPNDPGYKRLTFRGLGA